MQEYAFIMGVHLFRGESTGPRTGGPPKSICPRINGPAAPTPEITNAGYFCAEVSVNISVVSVGNIRSGLVLNLWIDSSEGRSTYRQI